MERKKPHTVTLIWASGFERDYEHSSAQEAIDAVRWGISWSNPRIKFARIYDDTGEPARLESADTVGLMA